MVEYLLHNGILSNQKLLAGKSLTYNEGINVIENWETPFYVSKFYSDLFKDQCDYPITYPCYTSNKDNSYKIRHTQDNYAINLCMHEGNLYGIDLTKKIFILSRMNIL